MQQGGWWVPEWVDWGFIVNAGKATGGIVREGEQAKLSTPVSMCLTPALRAAVTASKVSSSLSQQVPN